MVVTVKLNASFAVTVRLAALETVGTWSTVSVKCWVALPRELAAVIVTG